MRGQLVVAVIFQAALSFLLGQSLFAGLKRLVDIRRLNGPVVLLFADSFLLCRCFESASSMILLTLVGYFVAPKVLQAVFRRYGAYLKRALLMNWSTV
jgi:hypothetical protein